MTRLDPQTFRKDAFASFVVFLVALPLCMGIAIASGLPPAAGLVTGIIGGLIVGSIAGSPLQVSGPAAGLTVIVYEIVHTHGVAALGPIVLVAGLIQIAMGLFGIGRWFRAISPAVIHGMLAGIGLLIVAGQIHVMVDDAPRTSGLKNLLAIPEAIWKGIVPLDGSVHHIAAALGVMTIVVIVAWSYVPARYKLVPPALMGVGAASLVAWVFQLPIRHVDLPDSFATALVFPTSATLTNFFASPALMIAAATIALVASAETMLSASAVDRLHTGPRTDYDKEMRAQGVGNALCGALGALPMTGVIVRSSANVQAGAVTRMSAVLHGAWLLAFVLAAPAVLEHIPLTALAALLVYTGFKLLSPHAVQELRVHGRSEVAIYLITAGAVVATNLLEGIVIGFVLALLKQHWILSHLGSKLEVSSDRKTARLTLEGAGTFLAVPKLVEALAKVPAGAALVVDMSGLRHVDQAFVEAISDWQRDHQVTEGSVEMDWDGVWALHHASRPSTMNAAEKANSATGELTSRL